MRKWGFSANFSTLVHHIDLFSILTGWKFLILFSLIVLKVFNYMKASRYLVDSYLSDNVIAR